ncbi:MAG: hypothetical protein GAK29_03728 [Acinetobacter bereziniae]|uniref:Uncharacterized protein n=1 Tax=Acinetobacter bereziniae TaxID=106648 RepID=A0A833PB74_ACIBZ|nr:MAG: hypothetical protein GAK29_03728 [Acinetobacter bereziniae]
MQLRQWIKKLHVKKPDLKNVQQNSVLKQRLESGLVACKKDLINTALNASITIQIKDIDKNLYWSTSQPDQLPTTQKQDYPINSEKHYIYKAYIIDPITGLPCGEVILFDRNLQENIFGQLAATQCADNISQKIQHEQRQHLTINAFSMQQKIMINDQSVLLTPRQFEILCILILNPMGLSLEQLHIYLYGDENISLNTLKSEISYLKNKVGELICARTYQIQAEIDADFKQLEDAVDAGYLDTVRQLDQGDYFAKSKSPFLIKWQQILLMRIQNLMN